MPRTRQTSRKFTGGKAHRRQLATKAPRRSYSSNDDSSNEGQNLLVSIYNSTHTRTIAVDGEDCRHTSAAAQAPHRAPHNRIFKSSRQQREILVNILLL